MVQVAAVAASMRTVLVLAAVRPSVPAAMWAMVSGLQLLGLVLASIRVPGTLNIKDEPERSAELIC